MEVFVFSGVFWRRRRRQQDNPIRAVPGTTASLGCPDQDADDALPPHLLD
jgi:hypothetical protein